MPDLPKQYDAKNVEEEMQKKWEELAIYKFDHDAPTEVFSVDTPPPTVSGKMHLGHSFSYAQQDFMVRFWRMRGRNILYPFGTDDNGLPTDKLVEKTKKVRSKDFSREDYRKLALETVKELKGDFISDWKRLGMSCDFSETYSTIDPKCQKIAQQSFLDLYKKGLVYREDTPVAWCVQCQTAIAQAEFDNVENTSHFNDVKFSCAGKDLVIATTRPELIPACVALFAHPEDERYSDLKGKFAKVPLFDYEVPVLFDSYVDREKGTGLMMVCTFGDKDDAEKWREYKLTLRVVITRDGKMDKLAVGYEGLSIKDARKKILEDLETNGLLAEQKDISHAVNVHERCGTEIEFLKTKQWFIKLLDKKEELIEAGDKINWYPAHMKTRYTHWVQNLNYDWCISRQRFYGVPFPVWYTSDGEIVLAGVDELPVDPTNHQPKGKDGLVGEQDVMDTWNISSLTPQIVLDWKGASDNMKLFPMNLRPQAHDIIRTWAFYTIVKGLYHHGTVPWKDISISGFVLDPKGRKMSKSKGNAIEPQAMLDQYGADALRFWAAGSKLGDDLPFMEKDLLTGKKMLTKMWNATKFAMGHLEGYEYKTVDKLNPQDRWILSRLHRIIKAGTESFEKYEYSRVKLDVEKFFWQDVCDNYLEMTKDILYNPEGYEDWQVDATKSTLYRVVLDVLKLLAPILPHITDELYTHLFAGRETYKSIHVAHWPDIDEGMISDDIEKVGDSAVAVISAARKSKSEKNLSLKTPIKKLSISGPDGLKEYESVIKSMTKAEEIVWGEGEMEVAEGVKVDIVLE